MVEEKEGDNWVSQLMTRKSSVILLRDVLVGCVGKADGRSRNAEETVEWREG